MVTGDWFVKKVKDYFSFLIDEFGYVLTDEEIAGNYYYTLSYSDGIRSVSVLYENIEDYFTATVSILQNGVRPNYDDKTKTLHLNKLNEIIRPSIKNEEVLSNNGYFKQFQAENEFDRKLLKSAKEIRLCLKHFGEINL
ncbi:hypothetical protein [Mucilaginibacter sp.]|uniref:hypothetical protein n=1 Tax=Mucilaginibacter sp. TaxID=1882438 RepID=UPI0025E80100|nr:hypothetical protein [Mucilaginibacter sp.]